jgi:methyl-accepting chemotaxis protein
MLLLQAAATADTLIVQQLPPVRTAFEQVVFVASGLTSILTLLLLVALLLLIGALRAKAEETKGKLDDLLVELRPMAKSATAMYEDVRAVAAAASAMVAESRDTVRAANQRVRKTVDTLSDRVDELSGMIGRVNRSAERVAAVAGTALGGLKLGARALGLGRKKKKKKGRERGLAHDDDGTERPRLRRRV